MPAKSDILVLLGIYTRELHDPESLFQLALICYLVSNLIILLRPHQLQSLPVLLKHRFDFGIF